MVINSWGTYTISLPLKYALDPSSPLAWPLSQSCTERESSRSVKIPSVSDCKWADLVRKIYKRLSGSIVRTIVNGYEYYLMLWQQIVNTWRPSVTEMCPAINHVSVCVIVVTKRILGNTSYVTFILQRVHILKRSSKRSVDRTVKTRRFSWPRNETRRPM